MTILLHLVNEQTMQNLLPTMNLIGGCPTTNGE